MGIGGWGLGKEQALSGMMVAVGTGMGTFLLGSIELRRHKNHEAHNETC